MLASKLELVSNVLKIRRYALIGIVSSVALGILYFFLTMQLLPQHFGVVVGEYGWQIGTAIALTVTISALGGINIALIIYRINRMRMMNSAKSNATSVLGGAFAAFTPGCPACTAPLAVVLGAVGGMSIFPLQGLELKLVSVAALAGSIYWISRSMQKSSCCSIK